MAHTIKNNPNTPSSNAPFTVATSYDPNLFASAGSLHGGGDAGFGSLYMRDVATDIVMYEPFRFAGDTIMQIAGKMRTTLKPVVEWYQTDRFMPSEAVSVAVTPPAGSPAGITITLNADDAIKFRIDDKIRYEGADGEWHIAHVTNIASNVLTLVSPDGTNLPAAEGATTTLVQRLGSARGHERNLETREIGSYGKLKYTYVETMSHELSYTDIAMRERNYIDVFSEAEDKVFDAYRLNRTANMYYGVLGKRTLANGDTVYSSPGLWDLVSSFNKQESSLTTTGNVDPRKVKNAIYTFFEHNFGGEGGGPYARPMLTSARMSSILGQVFEDKQRFYGTEYIGGIQVSRFEHNNLGVIDFVPEPFFEYRHPLVDGSLKQGSGKAVGLMVPPECVTRVIYEGYGVRSEIFRKNGGDDEEFVRVRGKEGLQLENIEYCAAFVEA